MPELPEVETVKRSLEPVLKDKQIVGVHITYSGIIKGIDADSFKNQIIAKTFTSIERRGKYLIFRLSSDWNLVIHLRMTGQLIYCAGDTPINKHTHLRLELAEGNELRFVDIRKFGMVYLKYKNQIEDIKGLASLGPEPLAQDFTYSYLKESIKGKKTPIKAFLLDQQKIAGIGNIYADEILFQAGIHPARMSTSLSDEEMRKLYQAVKYCLQKGIENRGTSFRDYVDGRGEKGRMQEELFVYGRSGQPCKHCQTTLIRIITAGRGTVYCPQCQVKKE